MNEQTLAVLHAIQARLRTATHRLSLAKLLHGLALCGGVLAAVILCAVGIEAGFWIGTTPRSILFFGILVPLLIASVLYVIRPLLRLTGLLPAISETMVAGAVGQRYPEIADRLANMLDLANGRSSSAPASLVDGAVRMLADEISPVDFERVASFAPAKRALRWAALPVSGLLLFAVVAPTTFLGASHRVFSPSAEFDPPAPFSFHVEPGAARLVRGDTLNITARTAGSSLPHTATLYIQRTGEELSEEIDLRADPAGTFQHSIAAVRDPFRYRFEARSVQSDWYSIAVATRPIVRGLQVDLVPPAYTGLQQQRLPLNAGNITALAGTRATVRLQTDTEYVATAWLEFAAAGADTLALDGDRATGTFAVRQADTYQVILEGPNGVRNADPIPYSIEIVPDVHPSVDIIVPESNSELDPSLVARVEMRLHDDFGFSSLRLYWRLAESRFSEVMTAFVPLELTVSDALDQIATLDWDLGQATGLDIVPGDAVEFFAEVADNDAVGGFKTSQSGMRILRMPSLAERYAELDETQEETESEMEALLSETQAIREKFDELRDELRQKPQGDWEDTRQLESIQDAQERLEERIEELSTRLESAAGQMEDHALVSEETLELFQELQRVTEEIQSPELMEALRAFQQAMEQLDPRQMQEAIEQFEFNKEMFRERIERALELFKRFQLQKELEEAARRSEDLAEVQQALAEETADAGAEENHDALSREQLQAREDMQELEESMADIARRMEETANTPHERMNTLNEETERLALPDQMMANAQQMQQGQLQQANAGQRRMQQQMQQLQGQLQQLQESMESQRMKINAAGLRRTLRDVLLLSHDQEALRVRLAAAAADSPANREMARRQQALSDGLSAVADSLQRLAQEIPQLTREVQRLAGASLQAMEESTTALADRRGTQAVVGQRTAMTHLNELALLLSDLLEQLMNASSSSAGSGMSMEQMTEQLQQMARQQAQLNEQIQQMLNQTQGQRLAADMQARMRQLGMQQKVMQRQLREMSRNRDVARQLTGDLGKIAEAMEESIRELERGSVSRRTQQRQQEILTRLLDASRSMQERGRERRREGRRGEEIQRESPQGTDPAQAALLRRALLDALERGYTPDYEELIKRYFLLLQGESR